MLIRLEIIDNSCYGFPQGSHIFIGQEIVDDQISIVMKLDVIMQTEMTEIRQRYVTTKFNSVLALSDPY